MFENRDYEFISLQIDGLTETDFYCSFEGLYYYAFFLSEVFFGAIWCHDIATLFNRPGLYTGKYLTYYCVSSYFAAFGFSIVLYFASQDNFTSVIHIPKFKIHITLTLFNISQPT